MLRSLSSKWNMETALLYTIVSGGPHIWWKCGMPPLSTEVTHRPFRSQLHMFLWLPAASLLRLVSLIVFKDPCLFTKFGWPSSHFNFNVTATVGHPLTTLWKLGHGSWWYCQGNSLGRLPFLICAECSLSVAICLCLFSFAYMRYAYCCFYSLGYLLRIPKFCSEQGHYQVQVEAV